jgi:hypothetical protein
MRGGNLPTEKIRKVIHHYNGEIVPFIIFLSGDYYMPMVFRILFAVFPSLGIYPMFWLNIHKYIPCIYIYTSHTHIYIYTYIYTYIYILDVYRYFIRYIHRYRHIRYIITYINPLVTYPFGDDYNLVPSHGSALRVADLPAAPLGPRWRRRC